ncbi:Uma2 family endonuclease [soil metagenome]
MNTILHPPKTIYEVWESLPEGTLCQLINNNLVISPSPIDIHQVILNKINNRLFNYLEKNPIGELRIAPYDVHFSKRNIFHPDLIFIANNNLNNIQPKGLVGIPDLVIEVLSPGTAHKDEGEKKDIYEQYGVQEYFIINPETKNVQGFILREKIFVALDEASGVIHSELLQTKIEF